MSKAIRQQVVERLWEITEKLNILYKDNWTALADREMVKFQTELFAQQKEIDKNEGGGVLGMILNKISIVAIFGHKEKIYKIHFTFFSAYYEATEIVIRILNKNFVRFHNLYAF